MTKSHSPRAFVARVRASLRLSLVSRTLLALLISLVLLAWLVLHASPAYAREPSRVVMVRERPRKDDAFLAEAYLRLASELRTIGFEVRERSARGEDGPRAEVEADRDAVASILVRRAVTETTTDIWIADHFTHKTVLRKIDPHDDPATLAMLVLELMRASMIEPFASPSRIAPPTEPPSEAVTHLVEQAPPAPPPRSADKRVTLDVGASILWGDLGLAVAPTASVALRVAGPFKVGALALAPAFGAVVRGEQGVAHVRQELGLVELQWHPASSYVSFAGRIRPRAAIGLGVYHLAVDGDARDPYRDARDGAWAFLTSASAGGSLALSHTARWVLDARILVGFPRPVIRFASQEIASSLRPSIAFTTGLEVDL